MPDTRGLVVENNDFYVSTAWYTDCNGNCDSNGHRVANTDCNGDRDNPANANADSESDDDSDTDTGLRKLRHQL